MTRAAPAGIPVTLAVKVTPLHTAEMLVGTGDGLVLATVQLPLDEIVILAK